MSKLPKKIKILGVWYTVKTYKRILRMDGDDKTYGGVIKYNESKIDIWERDDIQQMMKTLWHEIYHAFMWESRSCENDTAEYLAQSFSSMMMGLEYKY